MARRVREKSNDAGRIEGARAIGEAVRAGRRRVLEVTLPEAASTAPQRELEALLREHGIPLVRTPDSARPVARAEPFPEEPFEELLSAPGAPMLVALDRVTDVGNLGSIARSAETAGAAGLLLEHRNAAAIGAGVFRASAGAIEHLRVGRAPNLTRALAFAQAEGFLVLGADGEGAPLEAVPAAELRRPLIWVLGSEDRGLRQPVLAQLDHRVGIPLRGQIASLGVAAAAAHLLHRAAQLRHCS